MKNVRNAPGEAELLTGITAKAWREDLLRVPSGLRKKSLVVGVFISFNIIKNFSFKDMIIIYIFLDN